MTFHESGVDRIVADDAFAQQAEPLVALACGGRISLITWFRTPWQRGGSLTGYTTFRDDKGIEHQAVVKLPVAPCERLWLTRLQAFENVAPRLFAAGDALGGYDLAWVVMERLPYGPLDKAWAGAAIDFLIDTAGRFFAAVDTFDVDTAPPQKDWDAVFRLAQRNIKAHSLAHEHRWRQALKNAQRKIDSWLHVWRARDVCQWCHGDLHLSNAMTRREPPHGPAVLLDMARIHAGHWVEDAVYFEHLYWSAPGRLAGRKVCSQLAKARRAHGLSDDDDWPRLAQIRRALLAVSTPAMLEHEGPPRHVEAALEVLEREV